jgi:tRNA G18 (ribose-2'-O)-methylase SpoU
VKPAPITLVGDGIENPWNARTMRHAAAMFGSCCLFRDREGLAQACEQAPSFTEELTWISTEALAADYSPLVALDNLDGAASLHGFQLKPGPRPVVLAGNERTGIARDLQAMADGTVQIPLASRRLNCLNVAAASAIALYYLTRSGGPPLQVRGRPEHRRPELLLMGASDHVELGSSIRSAGAFGWERVFVEDRAGVWFGCDRSTHAEGRAAARRQRNPIRLVSSQPEDRFPFEEVCVMTTRRADLPLSRANLARGARHASVDCHSRRERLEPQRGGLEPPRP